MTKLKQFLTVFILILTLFTVGCANRNKLPPDIQQLLNIKDGSVVRLGVYGDPWNLNPISSLSEHGQMVCNFIHASPLRKNTAGVFIPSLFDSWYFSKGASGTIIMDAVWKRGLKWSDGTPFDPNDLKFTIEQMRNPKNGSPYAKLAKGVLSVSSFGQRLRTRIVFASDSRRYLDLLTVGIIPSHIIKKQKLADAKLPAIGSETPKLYTDYPVGLGAYKIVKRIKGSYILLEPSGQKGFHASAKKIIIRSYFSVETLLSDFRSNKLDWVNLPSEYYEQVKEIGMSNAVFTKYPNPSYMVWVFNNKKAPFNKSAVRRALNLIANREKIRKQIPFTGQQMYCSPISTNIPGLGEKYSDKLAKAKTLLDENGIKDTTNDGFRDFNGKKFSVSITYNKEDVVRKLVAESLIEDMKKAGIAGVLKPVSWSDLINNKLGKSDFETSVISYQINQYGNWNNVFSTTHKIGENLNYANFSDPDVDNDLMALDSMVSVPETEKIKLRKNMADLINQECPISFLFEPFDVGVIHADKGREIASSTIWDDVYNWKIMNSVASDSKKL